MGECMLNHKCLELVPFPKVLFTHTDVSFDGRHSVFEVPSAPQIVSPAGS